MTLETLTHFVLTPEFLAGAMTGLALTKVVTTAYSELLYRVLGVEPETDDSDNSE